MTFSVKRHPDALRRFVAAPFVFSLIVKGQKIYIESNDIGIALHLRRHVFSSLSDCNPILLWKIIRDDCFCMNHDDISIVDDGFLRTLSVGGTILTYDKRKHEIMGFLSLNASV